MERCFIIANGESRKDFDISRLWPYGKIIGINAIYRENPKIDYLVGVDIQMMNEVGEAQYKGAEVWTYPRQQIKHGYFQRFAQDKGWSSGPTATLLAIQKEFKEIYGITSSKLKTGLVNFNLFLLKATRPFLPPFFRLIAPARWAKQRITKSPNLRFSDKANY